MIDEEQTIADMKAYVEKNRGKIMADFVQSMLDSYESTGYLSEEDLDRWNEISKV